MKNASDYRLPELELLDAAEPRPADAEETSQYRDILRQTLDTFGIPGKIIGCTRGPRVTRFEIALPVGVSVKKVERLAPELTMNLGVAGVRVLAPIPGTPRVGVEVPNSERETVLLRSVMESDAWRSGEAELPVAVGRDVAGKPVVLDLAKAPHLLISGATGTGKTVCINSLVMSLLFKFAPDELKFVMIDPKVIEFEEYRELPHLLVPIITDPNRALSALRWVADEIDRRYRVLAKAHTKKLAKFNGRSPEPAPIYDDDGNEIPAKMPYLVVVIDELAGLMATKAKPDIEFEITRIAQKGRAAGIHLVVATQRPSANVITGFVKANLPTRLCFQVRTEADSRVVLDCRSAEKLLGMGDMLLMSPSSMTIERVQGAFVSDENIRKVVKFVCGQAKPGFDIAALPETADIDGFDLGEPDGQDNADLAPLVDKYLRPGDSDKFRKALEIVILDRRASTSYLQRRLKIGYSRAAEIVDELEARRVIGPPSGSGNKREVLIFRDAER